MRKSLYKPKKNRAGKRGGDAAGKGKGKAQKESEFLLFDPLLDKKPEGKDGKTKGKKPLNRIELEEQRRGRRNGGCWKWFSSFPSHSCAPFILAPQTEG